MSRFHCLKCNEDAVYVYANDGHHFGCNGRVIPIATLCNEPTTIDKSDLAPGMVVVAVDELFTGPSAAAFLCSPDARLDDTGLVYSDRLESVLCIPRVVRYIAGKVTP